MDQEIIKDALHGALTLLNNQVESVLIPELSEEYYRVIGEIEAVLKQL
jgi:hypothetical protein